jgi:hypothetical protein
VPLAEFGTDYQMKIKKAKQIRNKDKVIRN